MTLTDIILLAIALGVDCLIVSFCQGLFIKHSRTKNSTALALSMGIFQGGMPLISYLATEFVSNYLVQYTKWIVFTIFISLGIKFLIEAFQPKEDCKIRSINLKSLILLGIATSIDALGAGVGLNLTSSPLFKSVIIIGVTSFIMSLSGFWFGNRLKIFSEKYLEIIGGLILTALALKAILL